jgi:surface antigen
MVKTFQQTWLTWWYLPLPSLRLKLRQVRKYWRSCSIAITIAVCLPISLSYQQQQAPVISVAVGISQIKNLGKPSVQSQAAVSRPQSQAKTTEKPEPAALVLPATLPLSSAPSGLAAPAVATVPAPAKRWYNGYAFGHCTYYVASRRPVPPGWGHARNWYWAAQKSGYKVSAEPSAGAIAWTPRGWYGHVAYVEQVDGNRVLLAEMNYVGWNRISRRWVSAADFKYIL